LRPMPVRGSRVMNYMPTYGWYYKSANDKSPSWTGVRFLYDFLVRGKGGPGPFAVEARARTSARAISSRSRLTGRSSRIRRSSWRPAHRRNRTISCRGAHIRLRQQSSGAVYIQEAAFPAHCRRKPVMRHALIKAISGCLSGGLVVI
jgi:hypothetical protein